MRLSEKSRWLVGWECECLPSASCNVEAGSHWEHLKESEVKNIIIDGEHAPGYAVCDGDSGSDDDHDYVSEDDTKPPARKRNKISDRNATSTDDGPGAAELTAADDTKRENCQYVEGGRTFEARVTDHRVVQSGAEKGAAPFIVLSMS